MKVMVLLAFTMRLDRGGIVAVGGSFMWARTMGGECYCGNLLEATGSDMVTTVNYHSSGSL